MKNKESRTKNSLKNVFTNSIFQVLSILANFINRTIFIKMLSADYLGINGLFTNILSVLSLAELGIGTAIVYSLYKPIKENDEEKICGLITYYKKMYHNIGVIVLVLGLMLIPFLPYIVNLNNEINHIVTYYILYLLNTVSSYFLIYKTSIVKANQKEFLIKKYEMYFVFLKLILQSITLIVFKSYFLYLCIQLVLTFLLNLVQSKKATKLYPIITKKGNIDKKQKKEIWDNIKALFLYQIGSVSLNYTDNILISIIVGTTIVGVYSNYSMIISSLASFTSLIFTSVISSIGNFNVDSSAKEKKFMFDVLEMVTYWIYTFCCLCLIAIINNFIELWIGKQYLLSNNIVYIIVFNFYITGMLYPIFCFRNTTNLFKNAKYVMLVATFLNIILSIILGKIYGIGGILIATALARILTNLWYEPFVLYKKYFKDSVTKYYSKKALQLLGIILLINIYIVIDEKIVLNNIFILMIVKLIICFVLTNAFMYIIYRKTDTFKYLYQKIMGLFKDSDRVFNRN